MNVLLRAKLVVSSSIVLPVIFCPFRPTILVTSTLVHLLEYITVMIISAALIAPVITSSGTLLIVTRFRIRDDTIGTVQCSEESL